MRDMGQRDHDINGLRKPLLRHYWINHHQSLSQAADQHYYTKRYYSDFLQSSDQPPPTFASLRKKRTFQLLTLTLLL